MVLVMDATTLKTSSLLLLAFQNLAYGLLLPYSRQGDKDGNVFFGPTAVVTTELMKIVIALCCIASEIPAKSSSSHRRTESKYKDISGQMNPNSPLESSHHTRSASIPSWNFLSYLKDLLFQGSSFKLLLPAILFVFQNNLQIQSASYLDATEFQVLSQLKIVTAAICSVFILKRHLNIKHWTSILLLMVGICIVQQGAGVKSTSTSPTASHEHPQAFLIGSIAMLGACCFSGIASITMEYLLKNEIGFWASNLLLATYSIIPASVPLFADIFNRGELNIYRYFTLSVWASIFLNAIGGLLVSMVMKYADNILKGFAVAASLIATVMLQSHSNFSLARVGGSLLVVCSMIGYSKASMSPEVVASLPLYDTKLELVDEKGEEDIGNISMDSIHSSLSNRSSSSPIIQ